MNEWNDPDVPPEEYEYGEYRPHYLVKLKGYPPTLAMRMDGEWWKDYTAKIEVEVLGWIRIPD